MRFARFMQNGRKGLAADQENGAFNACFAGDLSYPGELDAVIRRGSEALSMAGRDLLSGSTIDLDQVEVLPPLAAPGKIICIGLKYAEHAAESGLELPDYPTVFARFASSLIGHGAPIVRPQISQQLDYEGEVVAIVGRSGRNIPKATALVMSSGIRCSTTFRSATISCGRQSGPSGKTSTTLARSVHGSSPQMSFPPVVRAYGCARASMHKIVQDASTDDLVFDVATLVSTLSQAFTLAAGDIIVTGTPSGVGLARNPQLWMKPGDVCEVELEGLGVLRNSVVEEAAH